MKTGNLYLIPTDLAPDTAGNWIGSANRVTVRELRHFVAEHPKTARAFLKHLGLPLPELAISVLDEHSSREESVLLARTLAQHDLGLLSEAGCPAVADPGAMLVAEAHRMGAKVIPLVGPSSLVLSLMASGLNGQRFCFNGYLPQRQAEREQAIRAIEQRSQRDAQTEIFIEAPYRNDQMLASLLQVCMPLTQLCLATDLTSASEDIRTRSVAEWKDDPPDLDRRPTVFLLMAKPVRSANRRAGRGRPD
jgi:16S rRNA (cytidine1402-2'-O)-methyltransferase